MIFLEITIILFDEGDLVRKSRPGQKGRIGNFSKFVLRSLIVLFRKMLKMGKSGHPTAPSHFKVNARFIFDTQSSGCEALNIIKSLTGQVGGRN